MMKKYLSGMLALLLVLSLALPSAAEASQRAAIVEYTTEESTLTAFAKGIGEASSVSAVIAQKDVQNPSFKTLADSGIPMKTLILIDNSLSMPNNSRGQIAAQVNEALAARHSGEKFAIGSISQEIVILQDFTDDYTTLKTCVEGLEYQSQETDITDALYKYLDPNPFGKEECFARILLFSDGEAYEDIGHTNAELSDLLKGRPLPIYTVGVRNNNNNNNKDLENMFAWSRLTGAASYLLNDLQNKDDLAKAMAEDWGNLVVTMPIPAEAQNGKLETVTINFETAEGAKTISLDGVRMPVQTSTPPPAKTPAPATPTPEPEPEPEPGPNWLMIVLIAVGVLVVAGAVAAVLMMRKKKDDSPSGVNTLSRDELDKKFQQENGSTVLMEGSGTEMVGGTELVDGEGTEIDDFWGDKTPISTVTLTDVNDMRFRMKKSFTSSLLIGKNSDCDISINYDKTVSGRHCQITKEGGEYYIEDLNSTNGTIVNGSRIREKTPIRSGALIKMGKVEVRLDIED